MSEWKILLTAEIEIVVKGDEIKNEEEAINFAASGTNNIRVLDGYRDVLTIVDEWYTLDAIKDEEEEDGPAQIPAG